MTAALAIAAAAGLAALGAARRAKQGSRADQPHGQRFLGRFDRVSPSSRHVLSALKEREAFLDDMENNAGVLEQILPGVSGRHKDFELQIKDSLEPNAWYFGGSLPIFRFTSSPLSPGFISHQSIHMLDDEGKQWGSLVPNSPSRRLVQETSDLIRPHIDAYVDRKLEQGISHLPAKLREALLAGPVPWRDAHAILIEHHGSPYSIKEDRRGDPQRGRAVRRAASVWARRAPERRPWADRLDPIHESLDPRWDADEPPQQAGLS